MAIGNSRNSAPKDPLGKAIVLVFLAIWTLAAAGISVAFLGGVSAFNSAGAPGMVSALPGFMAIIPIGFVVIGILMFIKVAATPSGKVADSAAAPPPPPLPDIPPLPQRVAAPVPLACPGCGSRRNVPGAIVCAYCGGNMSPPAT